MLKNNRGILLLAVAVVVTCFVVGVATVTIIAISFLNREQNNEALIEAIHETTADRPYVSELEYTIEGVSRGKPLPSYVDYGVDEVWCFYFVPTNDEKSSGIGYQSGDLWLVELATEEEWLKNSCPNEYQENRTLLGLWYVRPAQQ
jgi:hypothetical protein